MAVRRIGRVGRIARVSKGGIVLGGHDILTVTNDGGSALYTTAKPHGLPGSDTVGEGVTISGCSVEGYNGTKVFNDAPTPTTFNVEVTSYTEDATGGRWD